MRYFSSDWHLGHERILTMCHRPFASVEAMNKSIIDTVNDTVDTGDELWLVGDVALGSISDSLAWLSRINCKDITLIAGNHDRVHPHMHRGRPGQQEEWETTYRQAGIRAISLSETVTLDGHEVDVCHFPFAHAREANSHDMGPRDRYAPWRPADRGQWLICGHVHGAWQQLGRTVNVGVDAWAGHLVNADQLSNRIRQGPAEAAAARWSTPVC